ncbi:hypothetical protein BLS_008418 [Venturia inaequalis]|uniref:Prenyltransferase alpha-alpha toroid domain-containing protein n=1 Tax=Venturia inaequalis TaxID=5025 RepID=A0A8H3Z5S4_VENIN|nr:hypothetical protein BLS_008418 [Venturia inaequalis]
MPIRPLRRKRAVQFPKMSIEDQTPATPASRITELDETITEDIQPTIPNVTELTVDDAIPQIPALFTTLPLIRDGLITESSEMQDETVQECLPHLAEPGGDLNIFGVSQLGRAKHVQYLHKMIRGPMPAGFTPADASRPWMVYWALTGLYLLGEDVGAYRDRKGMWHFLGRMKQKSGGFSMASGGEVDIRGAYCGMTIISLLNLPMDLPSDSPAKINGDETFLTNLKPWIRRCQTYEGGIGGAPSNEAHGAYAFCALACLSIIEPPSKSITSTLHMPSLISWLSSQQNAPESGFAGRTNKLVDGCYSHWVGGCWALISAALNPTSNSTQQPADLWSRSGLARYILCCCQNLRSGGLRDKPSKFADSYHTCYVLAGLSAAQNIFTYQEAEKMGVAGATAAFGWSVEARGSDHIPCEYMDRVKAVHPVYVIPFEAVDEARSYFEEKGGF